jgi:hypothetical protein
MKIRVGLVATVLLNIVLIYALYRKGDVKAEFKFLGVEFSLETKDKIAEPKHLIAPAEH